MTARHFDGRLVRARRRAADRSQADLAAELGVSRGAVASWERGAARPDGERLPALASALGGALDELFPREGAPDLADLRCDAGYAQYEIGSIVGTKRAGPVGDAERGMRRLDPALVTPLAEAYGVTEKALLAAQERSFGNEVAEQPHVPSSLADKINHLLEHTYPGEQVPPSDAEIARSVNKHADAVVISEEGVRDLRTGAQTVDSQVVYEGLAEFFGVTPMFFQSDEDVTRQVIEGLRLLASARQGQVSRFAARGVGSEGLSPDVLAFVNEVVAELAQRGLPEDGPDQS